jgi:hypothetical protein
VVVCAAEVVAAVVLAVGAEDAEALAACRVAVVILEAAREGPVTSEADVAWGAASMAAEGPAARASSMAADALTAPVAEAWMVRAAASMAPVAEGSKAEELVGLMVLVVWTVRVGAGSTVPATSPVRETCRVPISRSSPIAGPRGLAQAATL